MNPHLGQRPDPTAIIELSTAYWGSQALFVANRIGVFEALAQEPMTSEEVAQRLGLQVRPAHLLLKACVSLGFLEEAGEKFLNTPVSRVFLVPGTPAYLGDAIRYGDDMYAVWGRLEETVRSGQPALKPESYLGDDPERTRHFVYGMHNRALGVGRALAEVVDLSGRRNLLDVGGGPGTYSALLAARYPDLRGRVLDLPDVAAIGRQILDSMTGGDRVESVAGDYHVTPFPLGNDVVLISGVFHRETEATCQDLIGRARACLEPGGLLLVGDVFTDAGGSGPAFSVLFGLNMALSAEDGGVHSDAAVAEWMRAAGFEAVEVRGFPPPMPHRLVLGRTPSA